MRRIVGSLLVAASLLIGARGAAAQEGEGDGDFVPGDATTLPVIPDEGVPAPAVTDAPATTVAPDAPTTTALPAGCSPPPVPHALFLGTMTASDRLTARFHVDEVSGGSLAGYQVGELVDVDFFDDVRYLDVGSQYLIAVRIDDESGRLVSKVTPTLPRFGGDQVVGVDDRDVVCPTFDDPVITKMSDGAPVESGVLAPMLDRSGDILRAFLKPAAVAFAALVVLVSVKRSLVWTSRRFRRMWRRRRAVAVLASSKAPGATTAPQPR